MSTWRMARGTPGIIPSPAIGTSPSHREPRAALAVRPRLRRLVRPALPAAFAQPGGAHGPRHAPRRLRRLVFAGPRRRPAGAGAQARAHRLRRPGPGARARAARLARAAGDPGPYLLDRPGRRPSRGADDRGPPRLRRDAAGGAILLAPGTAERRAPRAEPLRRIPPCGPGAQRRVLPRERRGGGRGGAAPRGVSRAGGRAGPRCPTAGWDRGLPARRR